MQDLVPDGQHRENIPVDRGSYKKISGRRGAGRLSPKMREAGRRELKSVQKLTTAQVPLPAFCERCMKSLRKVYVSVTWPDA